MRGVIFFLLIFAFQSAEACDNYASWKVKDTDCAWTKSAEASVLAVDLASLSPSDVSGFCPKYETLPRLDKARFWVALISAISRPESNYKTMQQYKESFLDSKGDPVISRGLLQISMESANQSRYSCGIANEKDLHDPFVNIQCGVKILNYWVKKDGAIATYGNGSPKGGGRYWSVLREKNNHLVELKENTSGMSFCKKNIK